ncbi:MAG: hypothetical protein K2Q20_12540, partial [Phycisphaerales bacterium]|nr:hypothetical protein [Phycisphaerales bacterium]
MRTFVTIKIEHEVQIVLASSVPVRTKVQGCTRPTQYALILVTDKHQLDSAFVVQCSDEVVVLKVALDVGIEGVIEKTLAGLLPDQDCILA